VGVSARGEVAMRPPSRSYVLASTPRVGSHLLANGLASTGIAGYPREWLPRFAPTSLPKTAEDRFRLVTEPPSQADNYDPDLDGAYIRKILASGTSANGVFGLVIHWFVFRDAARRLQAFLDTSESAPHRVLSLALPNLSYVWLKRRDMIAQAVSWHKAIQTGTYVGRHRHDAGDDAPLTFDYGKIRYLLSALTSFENGWRSFFAANRLTPLVLYYEDLSADYRSGVRSVLDALELRADVDIAPPRHEKYADTHSLAWIEQFKRLQHQAQSAR
jgi:trehalose 2-sulfotransferase